MHVNRSGSQYTYEVDTLKTAAILQVVSIIEDCWREAAQRPTMKQIFERLKVIVDGLKTQESGHKSALR